MQSPSIIPDGRTIAYENGFELWTLSVLDGEPKRVPIRMTFDPKQNLVTWIESEGKVDGLSPSPDGSEMAVDFHGEIMIVPTDPKFGEMRRVTASPARDRHQRWSPDGKHIAWVSDASGDEEIWIYDVDGKERRRVTRHASPKRSVIFSPDSKRLAFTAANRLFLVDVASGQTDELAHNPEGGYNLSAFTSDGRWLVYSRSDADLDSEIYLFEIDGKTEHNVTRHRASERAGLVTPDGKTLVFTSDRDGGDTNLFAVSLARMTEDPDDPIVRAARAKAAPQRRKKDDDAETEKPASGAIKIDVDGIDVRPRQLTRGSDRIGSLLLSKDGKTVFYTRGGALRSVGVDGEDDKKVSDGSFQRLTLTADGKTFAFLDGGKPSTMSVKGGKKQPVPCDFRVEVDQRAEWRQIFNEAWRVMRYRFYDADMHGVDWSAMKKRYEPLLDYVGENQDLYDLTNEMIGELNASHTGVSGPPSRPMERAYTTRLLGFEMAPDGDRLMVSHIYAKGPADKEWIDLEPGDRVLSIDGHQVSPKSNYWKILNHVVNDYVTVEIARSAEDASRKIRLKTMTSYRGLKYEAWVESRRAKVDELSGGKIGYVHIRYMNRSSLARFETEINQFWNKNGMIIDIRYNGGGNIDQQLIDILERRPYEYWNSRWGGRARGRRPRQCIAGPKVMLINWRSASDSEVTPQAFRDLGLGRIVGNPTYGAVIATGSYRLMNGGRIRTPGSLVVTYDPTKPHNYGINLENFGVPPDVWIENSPADELKDRDRELEAAVTEALRMLASGTYQFGEDK